MIASIRAAWFADRKRPAVWTVAATWTLLAVAFGIGIPYVVHLALAGDPAQAEAADTLLSSVLPEQVVPTGIALFPLFGGAMVVILGALVVGNEYRWGTLNLIFTQRPRRAQVMLGHAAALGALTLLLVLGTFAALGVVTSVLALVEGRGSDWPPAGDLLGALAAAWLICAAYASLGYFLAIAFRGAATAIAVGLVWTLLVENAVSGLALVLKPLGLVQKVLLAPSAGSLAGALGARSQFEGGTPGVIESSGPWLPAIVLILYVLVLVGLGTWLAVRRDVN
ncbi:ABC transporter permease subunit [Micromonospora sp. PLK6-60]|uniref:ABC transporter permease subunit n=1 Tax=Micromonospora sp. PLK6-60 TaxID=2873383 RepID=UPI001CA62022|nr:ABC transporter permease subunit [Micromonospora sp. PLK6-60]MBY8872555.1 ABC transporter permease subunit [Micromonospora sp. PLK6-60]